MDALILASGSQGNCTAIRADAGSPILLLDAGITKAEVFRTMRAIGWEPNDIGGIAISHEHVDHVAGLTGLSKYFRSVPLAMTAGTAAGLGLVPAACLKLVEHGKPFIFEDFTLMAVGVSHDAREPVAWHVLENATGVTFCYVMDLGCIDDDTRGMLTNSQHIFIESNYDNDMLAACRYRQGLKERIISDQGHLSNEHIAQDVIPAMAPATKQLILGHVSGNANDRELAYLVARKALRHCGRSMPLTVFRSPVSLELT